MKKAGIFFDTADKRGVTKKEAVPVTGWERMMKKSRWIKMVMMLGTLGILVVAISGAPETGIVFGTVVAVDASPVPGAEVSAFSEAHSRSFRAMTQKDGSYRLEGIPVGKYRVTVRKTGFVTTVRKGVFMEAGGRVRLDFRLKPQADPSPNPVEEKEFTPECFSK